MICLDTNYLIRGLVPDSSEANELVHWTQNGVPLVAPMMVWYAFLCGPVTPRQISAMRTFLDDITPFSEKHAEESARLFNAVGRKRRLRADAIIAGTAIAADARLATNNLEDFELFRPHGLKFV